MDTIRQVSFDEAEEGVVLLLRNRDLRTLYRSYGPTYFEDIFNGLLRFDVDVMEKVLVVAAKKDDKPHAIKFDDLDHILLEDVQSKLLDAFSLSVTGRDRKQQMAWVEEQLRKSGGQKDDGDPPAMSPEASSGGSSELLSG